MQQRTIAIGALTIRDRPATPRPARCTAGWLSLLAAASLLLGGCAGIGEPASLQTSMPPADALAQSLTSKATVSQEPLESLRSPSLTPVYWLGQNDGSVFLYREFSPVQDKGDPVVSAVTHMLAGRPADPDYFSPWRAASKVGASFSQRNEITIDLPASAFGTTVDEGIAQRAVQQLVFTATAAAANAGLTDSSLPVSVVILVDGHKDYLAFGHVDLSRPIVRNRELIAPVWIIDPQQDVTVSRSVRIHGIGVSPDATLDWELLSLDADPENPVPVDAGRLQIEAGAGVSGSYEVRLNLEPGRYEVRVFHTAAASGTSSRLSTDSKQFTVR